jgi:hypothetical protein
MNFSLPLQFRHPGPPFPTLLRPMGHPQNSLKFWLVGWSVSLLVGWSVTGKSHERHAASSVLSPGPTLQFLHLGLPFPTLLRPAGHPQNGFKFWSVGRSIHRSVGRSVGRSVTGKSHERHTASSVLSPGPTLPDPSMPCGSPPKQP